MGAKISGPAVMVLFLYEFFSNRDGQSSTALNRTYRCDFSSPKRVEVWPRGGGLSVRVFVRGGGGSPSMTSEMWRDHYVCVFVCVCARGYEGRGVSPCPHLVCELGRSDLSHVVPFEPDSEPGSAAPLTIPQPAPGHGVCEKNSV